MRSLCVLEPPAFAVARDVPEADRIADALELHWRQGPRDPEAFLHGFLAIVGGRVPPGRLSRDLLRGAELLQVERLPQEARIPLAALAASPFPRLAVSGAHDAGFDAVCDALAREAGFDRAVLAGSGHVVQRARGFNELLASFLDRAEAAASGV